MKADARDVSNAVEKNLRQGDILDFVMLKPALEGDQDFVARQVLAGRDPEKTASQVAVSGDAEFGIDQTH
jgi:hypothetical protein